MLYDLFICHASEDKEAFVRPLAEQLQKENIRVWYDEFSLKLGDSIRRSIDKGLSQSRFGVIVISTSFLKKQWTQYELDGLLEKEISGNDKVILPIWHNITYKEVLKYSPSLANKKAALSDHGLDKVVKELIDVIHPQGSPLIVARDTLLEWGVTPPVITDEYWLDVIEASNRTSALGASIAPESIWGRWSFPLPRKEREPEKWGERLAWAAMQLAWTQKADAIPITPLTDNDGVLEFIYDQPGLYETCAAYPLLAAEYAPQLTIKGFGGELEEIFEEEYLASKEKRVKSRLEGSINGSGLSVDGKAPECDTSWALRHEEFGYYRPDHIAYEYFHGGMFGPPVSPYYDADHLFWLLSKQSSWLPLKIHNYLLQGMMQSTNWTWGYIGIDRGGNWKTNGKFTDKLGKYEDQKKKFQWDKSTMDDVKNRIRSAIAELGLPETVDEMYEKVVKVDLPQRWIEAKKGLHRRKSNKA